MIRVYVLMYDLLRSHNYFRDDLLRHTKSTYFPIILLNCYDSVVFVFVILFTTVIAVNDGVPLEKIISPCFFYLPLHFVNRKKMSDHIIPNKSYYNCINVEPLTLEPEQYQQHNIVISDAIIRFCSYPIYSIFEIVFLQCYVDINLIIMEVSVPAEKLSGVS